MTCCLPILAHAGLNDTDVMEPRPPPCERYQAGEWSLTLWGAYAFADNQGNRDFGSPFDFSNGKPFEGIDGVFAAGSLSRDRFLNKDEAWGGGLELKYFWTKNLGLGLEGWAVDAQKTVGAGLVTFTMRCPIGCSRVAPYFFAGVGAIFGGSRTEQFLVQSNQGATAFFQSRVQSESTRAIGQFGGGVEFRFNERIGWINDFSWNVVEGVRNNFGMVRTGISFFF